MLDAHGLLVPAVVEFVRCRRVCLLSAVVSVSTMCCWQNSGDSVLLAHKIDTRACPCWCSLLVAGKFACRRYLVSIVPVVVECVRCCECVNVLLAEFQ